MTKDEFDIWIKEHKGKCSIDDLLKLGFKNKFYKGIEYWIDSEDKFAIIFQDPIVEPIQPISTEELLKKIEPYLDSQHYESVLDIDLNKKWYDKFYEHKGRRYRR